VVYTKDGKVHTHPDRFDNLNDALAAAHELTRDWVADFTRVVALAPRNF